MIADLIGLINGNIGVHSNTVYAHNNCSSITAKLKNEKNELTKKKSQSLVIVVFCS